MKKFKNFTLQISQLKKCFISILSISNIENVIVFALINCIILVQRTFTQLKSIHETIRGSNGMVTASGARSIPQTWLRHCLWRFKTLPPYTRASLQWRSTDIWSMFHLRNTTTLKIQVLSWQYYRSTYRLR